MNTSKWLRENISRCQSTYDVDARRAFAMLALSTVLELEEDTAFEQSDPAGFGNADIHGWYYDLEMEQFHILYALWMEPKAGTAGITAMKRFVAAIPSMLGSDSKSKTTPFQKALIDARQDEATLVLHYVVSSEVSSDSLDVVRSVTRTNRDHPWVEVWTPARLHSKSSIEDVQADLAGITLEFKATSSEAIRVPSPASTDSVIGESLVINLSGKALSQVASPYKTQIVQANVRYHLGSRNKVNSKMRETMIDPESHKFFWYYNNGITILATDYHWDSKRKVVKITNPQVVNGCQTVSALIDKADEIPTDVSVLARIIKVSPNGNKLALSIAESTNFQTPVKSSDLRSKDPIHKYLHDQFEQLDPPWFYETKRGEWNSLGREQKKKFTTARRFDKIQVGQTWRMFAGEPSNATQSVDEMFVEQDVYHRVYQRDRDVKLYLLAYRVFNFWYESLTAERIVELAPGIDDELVARIMRARKFSAGHLTAMTSVMLERRYGPLDGPLAGFLLHQLDSGRMTSLFHLVTVTFRSWAKETPELKVKLSSPEAFRELRARELDMAALLYGGSLDKLLPDP